MTLAIPERRRSPRTEVGFSWLAAPATWAVEVLDLSMGGLSFVSPYGLEVGRTASVRTILGREAFSGQIRVCWSRPRGAAGPRAQFDVGAAFLPLDESSRRVLESFLKSSPTE